MIFPKLLTASIIIVSISKNFIFLSNNKVTSYLVKSILFNKFINAFSIAFSPFSCNHYIKAPHNNKIVRGKKFLTTNHLNLY